MSAKRFPEEFKIQAVKQVTEKGHSVASAAERLDISTNSLYLWLKRYGSNSEHYQELSEQEKRIKALEKELRRTQQERDLLKEAALDSIGQRNNHMKILFCGGLLNETYIYSTRKRVCF
ncbi:transposase [Thalassotalea eurytherma]|uniref:Transposase YkgN n=1 Tax=Thalassotalea eurytherma TaxID=1144278 RepID=A0ABQ6H5Z1_9GAMM|nr:transposase [Thalassotalea eurytherma]GLX82580.1 putative transposase YkgN [Thalassotalea eurytherma]